MLLFAPGLAISVVGTVVQLVRGRDVKRFIAAALVFFVLLLASAVFGTEGVSWENAFTLLGFLALLGLAVSVVGTVVQLVRQRDAKYPALAGTVFIVLYLAAISLEDFGVSMDGAFCILVELEAIGVWVSIMGVLAHFVLSWLPARPARVIFLLVGKKSLVSYLKATLAWLVIFTITTALYSLATFAAAHLPC